MTFSPKKLGCCLACGKEVYHVISYHTEGLLAGHPNRVGAMLEPRAIEDPERQATGVQVEFLLSDGSEADVAFCVACADALRPEDYYDAWVSCLRRGVQSYELAGRPRREMLAAMGPKAQLWPVAVKLWRKEAQEINALVLARRQDA